MKHLLISLLGISLSWSAIGRDTVRLMSFNIRHGEGMDGRIDLARTAARIRAEQADFVCLQELDWRTARVNGVDEPAELARLTGMKATFAKAIFYAGGQYGVMMLSREQPLSVVQVPLPGEEPRVLLLCEFADCVVGTTHLSVSAASERNASASLIEAAIRPFAARKPVFLTGDWNSQPSSETLGLLRKFLTVVSATDGSTFHGESAPKGPFCIDYIACDTAHAARFEVLDSHVVEDRVTSDHAPIVSTLAIPEVTPPAPALIPEPVSCAVRPGTLRLQACEVTTNDYAAIVTDRSIPSEGYRLTIDAAGIRVASSDDAGLFYAGETLRQLASFSYGRLAFPFVAIADFPRFGWRGVELDDSRHFFGKAAVKRTLELMARHKLNVFHWHLTDNEGWRLPLPAYPKLVTVGATRPYSTNQKDLADHFEDGVYGPFAYTEADIREVVAFAKARHIRIVPEVDFPGHSASVLRAYPELGCFPGGKGAPQGAVDDVLCAGNDRAIALMEAAFEKVCELFPESSVVHIGGDEVNKVNWRACPRCQARMKALNLTNANGLQASLARRFSALLKRHGRTIVGWDEIVLDGAPPEGAIVMSWRGAEGGIAAAKAGLRSVMCPHQFCYFDYTQCLADDPLVYPWFTQQLPLEKAYAYDPLDGIPETSRHLILGGQSCNWAEYTCNETELQLKMWPRTFATAEIFWSPASRRDYADFRRRVIQSRQRLIKSGVSVSPID